MGPDSLSLGSLHSVTEIKGRCRPQAKQGYTYFAHSAAKGATLQRDANKHTFKWVEVAPRQFYRGRAKREKYEEKSFSSINLSAALRGNPSSQLDDPRSTKALRFPPLIGRHSKLCSPLYRWSGGSDPLVRAAASYKAS